MSDLELKSAEVAAVNSGEPYDVYIGFDDLYYQLRDTKIENAKLSETVDAQHGLIQHMLTSLITLRRQVDELEKCNHNQAQTIINLNERIRRLFGRSLIDRIRNRDEGPYRIEIDF